MIASKDKKASDQKFEKKNANAIDDCDNKNSFSSIELIGIDIESE